MAYQPLKRIDKGAYENPLVALSGAEYDENLDRIAAEFEEKVNVGDARLSDARTPTAHATTHATGQPDALTPADIGAATAAQGALADSAQQPLTEGPFVNGDKTKLDGIAAGAEVNVNADWNADSGDAQILNKPTLGTAAAANTGDFATAAQGIDSREWTATTIDQAEAEAGAATTRRAFTAERVRQAIVAWWATISSTIATLSGAETLSNKTLGDLKELTSSVADAGAALTLDPLTGPLRSITLTQACEFTVAGWVDGQSQKLRINGDFAITWTGVVWMGDTPGSSGTAPAGPGTGFLHVELWKEAGIVYGARAGYSAS